MDELARVKSTEWYDASPSLTELTSGIERSSSRAVSTRTGDAHATSTRPESNADASADGDGARCGRTGTWQR
jgi:hypothetical protein